MMVTVAAIHSGRSTRTGFAAGPAALVAAGGAATASLPLSGSKSRASSAGSTSSRRNTDRAAVRPSGSVTLTITATPVIAMSMCAQASTSSRRSNVWWICSGKSGHRRRTVASVTTGVGAHAGAAFAAAGCGRAVMQSPVTTTRAVALFQFIFPSILPWRGRSLHPDRSKNQKKASTPTLGMVSGPMRPSVHWLVPPWGVMSPMQSSPSGVASRLSVTFWPSMINAI